MSKNSSCTKRFCDSQGFEDFLNGRHFDDNKYLSTNPLNTGKTHYLELLEYEKSASELINRIKYLILKQDCPVLTVNITRFNILDATRICTLSSVFHFCKYPDGTIVWQVKDYETYRSIKMLKLKNTKIDIVGNSLLSKLHKAIS